MFKLKTESGDTIILAEQCDSCRGDCYVTDASGNNVPCFKCDSMGYTLTDAGYTLMAFMRKERSL
jgi:hypothetical protein